MPKRFSEMSASELEKQINDFEQKLKDLKNSNHESEIEILQQKLYVARSYQLDKEDFKTGRYYVLKDTDAYIFKLSYINGVFAWGNKMNLTTDQECKVEAVPLALLQKEVYK